MKSNLKLHRFAQSLSAVQMNAFAPIFLASSSLRGLCDNAYVSAPRADANRRPKCPRPPLRTKLAHTQCSWASNIHSEDRDSFPWPASSSDESTVAGQASAKHRCRNFRRYIFRNWESEILVDPHMAGISSLGNITIGIRRVISVLGGRVSTKSFIESTSYSPT